MLKIENVTMKVDFGKQKNRSGQRPMTIKLLRNGAVFFTVYGARVVNGSVLDAVASLPGGKFVRHTEFSPNLQSEIIKAEQSEPLNEQE